MRAVSAVVLGTSRLKENFSIVDVLAGYELAMVSPGLRFPRAGAEQKERAMELAVLHYDLIAVPAMPARQSGA